MQIRYEKVPRHQNTSFYCYTNTGPRFLYSMHHHPECEIVIVLSGSGKCYISGRVIDYRPGDAMMFGPDLPHTFESSVSENIASRAYVIQFRKTIAGGYLWQLPELEKCSRLIEKSARGLYFADILSVSGDLWDETAQHNSSAGRLTALLGLLETLSNAASVSILPREPVLAMSKNPGRLMQVLNYVHNNSGDEVSVEAAAAMAGMSVSGFCKFFKRQLGRPFNDYLIETRIESACEMLMKTSEPVINVCFASGFNNLSNFNRQFIKRRGMPPNRYRTAGKRK
ncbi:HTH-type transcriptional regulator YesS [Limihaloglobus sulfuriphilus]|uniref:HTH-type transcriptional regulator YesS n=1 Tax=Limihaloglobus sulfuriphilus TaxID=1851148 RepID=A0A1Q2MGC3_9BACT|nr:AraC family transcriptional regulator [Limihaloglobus sulfuriphilus]AQQ71731.1 HTH-type transcriptional regulator YesS [Limihaloglobus sulfuriphilus]